MYESFYELKEKPFSLTPDPKFLYLSEGHRAALEHLIYGITQREGFSLITGEVGTGKTTICRSLLETLDQRTKVALILNPQVLEENIIANIVSEFGIKSGKKKPIDSLNDFLLQQLASGLSSVLIIDEAQSLSCPVMEQIRLLSNLETEKEKLIQIILIGQPELKTKLEIPVLRQLNQRISVRYHLTAMTKIETRKYIEHRLMIAGSKGSPQFSNQAISLIYKYSRGIPRIINLIADRCLLGGYSIQSTKLTYSIGKEAVKGLCLEDSHLTRNSLLSLKKLAYLVPVSLFLISLTILLWKIPLSDLFSTSSFKAETEVLSESTIPSYPESDLKESSVREDSAFMETEEQDVYYTSPSKSTTPSYPENDLKESSMREGSAFMEIKEQAVYYTSPYASYLDSKARIKTISESTIPSYPENDLKESSLEEDSAFMEIKKQAAYYPSYTIHLDSYRNKELALNASEKLKQWGYDIYITHVAIPDGEPWYQVLLGKFKSKVIANKKMQELKDNGLLNRFSDAVVAKTISA
ncbi:MAG: AAA family ATPase [Thermodesulfobacteriota bacterium]